LGRLPWSQNGRLNRTIEMWRLCPSNRNEWHKGSKWWHKEWHKEWHKGKCKTKTAYSDEDDGQRHGNDGEVDVGGAGDQGIRRD
jgi:hypothetical protein